MADRRFNQFTYALEKRVVNIFAKTKVVDATGGVVFVTGSSKGILSVTSATGTTGSFTYTFGSNINGAQHKDAYVKLLGVSVVQDTTVPAAAPTAPLFYIKQDLSAVALSGTITLVTTDQTGTAAWPASGTYLLANFKFGDSTAD